MPTVAVVGDDLTTAEIVAVRTTPGADGAELGRHGTALADELGVDLAAHLRRQKAKGEAGEVVVLPVDADRPRAVLMAGIGDGSPVALSKAGAAVGRRARDAQSLATSVAAGADAAGLRAFVEALLLSTYAFSRRSDPKKKRKVSLSRIDVVHGGADAAVVAERATTTAAAVRFARDLANTPSSEKSPAWLADRAVESAEQVGVKATVHDEHALTAQRFGGVLAVGRGSARPPRLIELSYRPRGATRHVVLVGKGITFDSGGLSIKPAAGMEAMKTDMAGGAAVIAVVGALAALGVRTRVTGLVPAAENMPSGSATRPGDVITQYGGRTVEVMNTDAEGRLVLADALAYAAAKLRPDVMVDIATLTGAATLGLGRVHGAVYATDDDLATALVAAGEAGGDPAWRMPLVEDYRDAIDSDVADLRNTADAHKHYGGGSITAALFLREFTAGCRWAHLDIAGPGRSDKDEGVLTKGATGYGVSLLLRWLEDLDGRGG